MEKYLFLVISFITITLNLKAQIYTPSGELQSTINNNQNIGIGTNNPQSKLDVAGGINILSGHSIQLNGNNISHGLKYKRYHSDNSLLDGPFLYGWLGGALGIKRDNNETNILTWNHQGNVGIGTNMPNYKLTVHGNSFSTAHTIQSWSPTVYLKRDTNEGGYT